MSLPLTRAGVVDVARIRTTLAARIADSALASATPGGTASRNALDTDGAVALLRRASAGWLRANAPTWQPLLAPAPAANGNTRPATTEPAALRTATLEIVRTVMLEVGNALQSAARSDLSRDAIARAVRLLLTELRRGLMPPKRETGGDANRATADATPGWAPFSPYGAPPSQRARRLRPAPGGAAADGEADDGHDEAPAGDADVDGDSGGDPNAALLDILRWLERHDGRADYGWIAGGAGGAPMGRVVDDSA